MFFTALLNNKLLIIIALLFTAIVSESIYIKILKSDIVTIQSHADILKGELNVSQASIKNLQQAITNQNIAVDKLKSDADARVLNHQAELAQAVIISNNYKKQAVDLLKRISPQNMNKCDAANQLIIQEMQNAK